MKIQFMGKEIEVADHIILYELLLIQDYQEKNQAVMVNKQFVPRSVYKSYSLHENDCIECIVPMQGG